MIPCILFLCCALGFGHCRNDVATLSDEDFTERKNSEETFSIYFYSDKVPSDEVLEAVLKSIRLSQEDFESQEIHLDVANCDKSGIPLCEEPEHLNHVIVFKEGEPFATISGDNLQTVTEVQAYMQHYAGPHDIDEVMGREEFKEMQKRFAGKNDLIIFYVPSLGSVDHLKMLEITSELPDNYELFYTYNKDLFEDKNIVWFIDCMTSQTEECRVTMTAKNYRDEAFMEYVQRSAAVTVLRQNNFPQTLKHMVNEGNDVLVLIAGPRKFQDALDLAKKVNLINATLIHTLVVDGTKSLHKDLQSRVENDKIFAIATPKTSEDPLYINIGFLENEDLNDVINEFSISLSRQDETWVDDAAMEETNVDDDESDHKMRPEEVQDDPMSFSVHYTKHVKDLYYFDYKTLPRLTDKTYEAVTGSKEYAVILFTLEFNPKALAALVTFVEIHNATKETGKSPMYRVECYNWPDVCQNAGVYTTPRMFFYPAETTDRIEYNGIWEKGSMKDAIMRYSYPSVIVVRKKEDILPYLPVTMRSVVGLFETEKGTVEFRKAAETLRKDFQFIELHGETAKFVAEQYEVDYADQRLLAFEHSFPKDVYGTFKTEQDIVKFCKTVFVAPELQELTIHTFTEILKDDKPLFIYFWNRKDGNQHIYLTQLKDTIQDIATHRIFASQVLFTWMNSSERSPGEFVLGRYNHKSNLKKPVVAFFDKKGSVILRSCSDDCQNTSLISWIQDCIDGINEPHYALSTEEWKPRLDGYDFLQMMKDDGTYPEQSFLSNLRSQLDEEGEKSSRIGRTVVEKVHKLKMAAAQEEDSESANEDPKSSTAHTEL